MNKLIQTIFLTAVVFSPPIVVSQTLSASALDAQIEGLHQRFAPDSTVAIDITRKRKSKKGVKPSRKNPGINSTKEKPSDPTMDNPATAPDAGMGKTPDAGMGKQAPPSGDPGMGKSPTVPGGSSGAGYPSVPSGTSPSKSNDPTNPAKKTVDPGMSSPSTIPAPGTIPSKPGEPINPGNSPTAPGSSQPDKR
jgi:hypothetical protein